MTATATATPTATLAPGAALNDDFNKAAIISAFPFSAAQDTRGATEADDDPDMAMGADKYSKTVWYRFTAPASQSARVNTFESDYDTVLAVFTGSRGHLVLVSSDDDTGGYQSQVTFDIQAGTVYYIEIAEFNVGEGGQLKLNVDLGDFLTGTPTPTATVAATALPTGTGTPGGTVTPTATATGVPGDLANDDFDAAMVINAFPTTITLADTMNATTADDDPDMGINGKNDDTLWFRFEAPASRRARIGTAGSSYDTVLAAYTGSRGRLTRVASNDDISPPDVHSQVTFNVQSGTTYYVEVAMFGGMDDPLGGQLTLSLEIGDFALDAATPTVGAWVWPTSVPTTPTATPQPGPAPANDDIGSAVAIGSFPYSDTRDTTGATPSSDDPDMGGLGQNSNTVWYRFTAASAVSVRADTRGSGYDTVLAAYTGSRGSLVLVASNDDISPLVQSEITFSTQPGVTYYLEVAQYGTTSGGGELRLRVESGSSLVLGTPTITGTPGLVGTPTVLGSAPLPIPPALRSSEPVEKDNRYFPQTGFRVSLDPFWDYFNKRGGSETFGYPISWEFPLLGFKVQMFQRGILQLMPNGGVASMNLLDDGIMPYTRINSSSFPKADRELIDSAPSPKDKDYGRKAIAFLEAYVPDEWEGIQVNFLKAYLSTVRYEDAFPDGEGVEALLPLFNLELWGLPTSKPAYDPNNRNFVYQRFQRGIMHHDLSTGATQGLLLADYLKSIVTGEDLPPDLDGQARGTRFYKQYLPGAPGYLARPRDLGGTNLEGAFDPD